MSSKSTTSKSKTSSILKQGKLSFASSKRTASAKAAQKPKAIQPKSSLSIAQISQDSETSNETPAEEEIVGEQGPAKTSIKRSASGKNLITVSASPEQSTEDQLNVSPVQRVELNEKDPKWRAPHAVAREKMGYLPPIHAQGQNKIHEILRVYDMNPDYGPCIGMTRLERWERAFALGLDPPAEVHEILETRQGTEDTSYSQSVLNDQV